MSVKEKAREMRDIQRIDVGLIDETAITHRSYVDPEEYALLSHDISQRGIRVEPRVKPAENGRFTLLHGGLRLRAAREQGITHVNCVVDESGLDEAEQMLEWLATNDRTNRVNDMDRAIIYATALRVNGWTQKQLADREGVSQGTVSRLVGLLDAPEELQEKVRLGEIPASVADQILKLPPRQRKEAIESGKLTRAKLIEQRAPEPEVFKIDWTREKKGRIGPCVVSFTGWKKRHTNAEMIDALQWAIDMLAGPKLADLNDDENADADDAPHTLPMAAAA